MTCCNVNCNVIVNVRVVIACLCLVSTSKNTVDFKEENDIDCHDKELVVTVVYFLE